MHTSWLGFGRKMGAGAASFLLLFGVAISSCEGGGGGGGGEGDSCRTEDDCSGDLYCRGPNQPNVCGVPPRELCASDADCSMGAVCHAVGDGCSPDGIGSECNAPCTADSCNPGFRCNAGGACEPIPCDEGFTCPDRQKCDPMIAHEPNVPAHARSTGCVNITCSADSGCPSGKFCVGGYCQDGLGTCSEIMLVP